MAIKYDKGHNGWDGVSYFHRETQIAKIGLPEQQDNRAETIFGKWNWSLSG
jgi:hypothetical protein